MFVSRSPLNVVHAGLDLLMSEIKEADPEAATVPISRSTVELIQHIFSSSESAIELLNDLLHYEQIDAGYYYPPTVTVYTFPYIDINMNLYIRNFQSGVELA